MSIVSNIATIPLILRRPFAKQLCLTRFYVELAATKKRLRQNRDDGLGRRQEDEDNKREAGCIPASRPGFSQNPFDVLVGEWSRGILEPFGQVMLDDKVSCLC